MPGGRVGGVGWGEGGGRLEGESDRLMAFFLFGLVKSETISVSSPA